MLYICYYSSTVYDQWSSIPQKKTNFQRKHLVFFWGLSLNDLSASFLLQSWGLQTSMGYFNWPFSFYLYGKVIPTELYYHWQCCLLCWGMQFHPPCKDGKTMYMDVSHKDWLLETRRPVRWWHNSTSDSSYHLGQLIIQTSF